MLLRCTPVGRCGPRSWPLPEVLAAALAKVRLDHNSDIIQSCYEKGMDETMRVFGLTGGRVRHVYYQAISRLYGPCQAVSDELKKSDAFPPFTGKQNRDFR